MNTSSVVSSASSDGLAPSHPALKCLLRLGLTPTVVEQVLRFYDEPHRRYHDRVHLREMFDAALQLNLGLTPAQTLAILFHDAIYVPGAARGANEAMSAQLLRVYCGRLPVPVVEQASRIVIDTAEHVPHDDQACLVLDLDLMRLAAGPTDFERYSRQVFEELRPLLAMPDDHAAWLFFEERRVAFFQRLLDRPDIFCSTLFKEKYELVTRDNLRASIAQVQQRVQQSSLVTSV